MSTQDGTYDAGKKAIELFGLIAGVIDDGDHEHLCEAFATALREAFEAGAARERACDTCGGTKVIYSDPAEGNPSLNGEDEVAMSCPDCDALAEARADLAAATARAEAAERERDEWERTAGNQEALAMRWRGLYRERKAQRDATEADARATRATLKTARSRIAELVMVIECRPLAPETPEHVRERCSKEMDKAAVEGRMFIAALEAATPNQHPEEDQP